MKTKIFISWSGPTSKKIGEILRDWIPAVLQQATTYFTPNDIEKGARWSKDISEELEASKVGIFCITKESLNSKWMMFEAGAISKNVNSSFVCPLLFNLTNSDLEGPITQFQSASFTKDEIKKLLITINKASGDNMLKDDILETVFEKFWNDLDAKVRNILNAPDMMESEIRSDRELIEEILANSRSLIKTVNQLDDLKLSLSTQAYVARHNIRQLIVTLRGLTETMLKEEPNNRDEYIAQINKTSKLLHDAIQDFFNYLNIAVDARDKVFIDGVI